MVPEFSLTAHHIPDVHIVALHGELDIFSSDWLTEALVEGAGSTVVVDLADLSFMDCSGIDALVAARNRILAEGLGQLVLARPASIARRTLEIVGLEAWIVDWSPAWA